MADAESFSPTGHAVSARQSKASRFNGLKLAVRAIAVNIAADGQIGAVPRRYGIEEIRDAESLFRRSATENLVNFVRQRVVTAANQSSPDELIRRVKQHALVVGYLVPLDYGGTLHQRNMMLTTQDQATGYRSFLDTQLDGAPMLQRHGQPQAQILTLAELGGRDETLFMLPRQGHAQLLLPLQHHDPVLLHSKPQRHNWRDAQAAFRPVIPQLTDRSVRRDRHAAKQALRQIWSRHNTDPA